MPQSVEGIQHGLSWAGLDYDFGGFYVATLPRLAEMTVIRQLQVQAELAPMDRTSRYMRLHASLIRSNNVPLVGEIGLVSSLLKKVA